ncbi:adenosine receptor A3-like [Littorina saxatilis]|uniref:adenosine receptor A3-like n=1 Tax=Littorina saxatilis TaxID=31220 RepID=UPI0038B491BE
MNGSSLLPVVMNHRSTDASVIVVYLVFECLIGVASVCTNSMVLLAILKERKLRTITNCFVGSLAAADVLVGFSTTPIAILTTQGLPKNFTLCVLMNSIAVQVALFSVLNLLSVALDRFCAICVPFHYRNVMTVARALRLVGIMWLFATFIGLIPLFGWNKGEHTFKYCSFDDVISLEYMVYLIFFAITLPSSIVMVMCYVYIFRVVRSTKKAILQVMVQHGREKTKKTISNNSRGDKGILMVIFLFMICWMPFHVVNCVLLWDGPDSLQLGVYQASIALSHCKSVVNPFLFAFGYRRFKVTIKSMLCGTCTTIESLELEENPSAIIWQESCPVTFARHLVVLGVSVNLTSNTTDTVQAIEHTAKDIRQHPFSGPGRERQRKVTESPLASTTFTSSSLGGLPYICNVPRFQKSEGDRTPPVVDLDARDRSRKASPMKTPAATTSMSTITSIGDDSNAAEDCSEPTKNRRVDYEASTQTIDVSVFVEAEPKSPGVLLTPQSTLESLRN